MRLRDMFCTDCGLVQPDVFVDSLAVTSVNLDCPRCRANTKHEAVCNGGLNHRYRHLDWPRDPRFYDGQVTVGRTTACERDDEGNETPVTHYRDGETIHDKPRFAEDAYNDKHDRRRWQWRKDRDIGGKIILT